MVVWGNGKIMTALVCCSWRFDYENCKGRFLVRGFALDYC